MFDGSSFHVMKANKDNPLVKRVENSLNNSEKIDFEKQLKKYDFMEHNNPLYTNAINYSSSEGKEKKQVLKKARTEVKDWLMEEHKLKNGTAKAISKATRPINLRHDPDKMSKLERTALFLANGQIGTLPTHYVKIYAEVTKQNMETVTRDAILTDYAMTALLAGAVFAVPELQASLDEGVTKDTIGILSKGISVPAIGNLGAKTIQLPYRTFKYFKDKQHIPGYAALINPTYIEGLILAPIFASGTLRDMENSDSEKMRSAAAKIYDIKEKTTKKFRNGAKYINKLLEDNIKYHETSTSSSISPRFHTAYFM